MMDLNDELIWWDEYAKTYINLGTDVVSPEGWNLKGASNPPKDLDERELLQLLESWVVIV